MIQRRHQCARKVRRCLQGCAGFEAAIWQVSRREQNYTNQPLHRCHMRASPAMNDRTATEERFTRLEIKAAYLEKLTADLNDVVVGQAQLIDDLVERLGRL